ncbi:DegT/DnrJ/EryC1/StrS family aminotransferase [Paludisphaera borealis]|uniref:DegT/DnrJ/EryC1/StrS aminotransferase n=1 Tax=Paludisphaera borealis TaxID=1387353 RepID=A0A1U7CLW4_9BACT|nr:DegT/DnrJ/EryC1/StrS family aminotransferase [Paludisphaera borealis]APW59907.1 DegT/DnrJ/EryC1/StrS aminotransferase [Paludisphaera borealis]
MISRDSASATLEARPDEGPVPFLDLKTQYAGIRAEILQALEEVADGATYVLGPRVAGFEEAFAAFVGARHCVGVNSGTSALHLALICAGVGPGDEVITVPMTFVATSWAVSYVGATPVFVDVDLATLTMDVRQVERRITNRTRAILPVHLYGQSADMGPLLEIGRRHGIPVVEDAAQAHGARCQERAAGTMGLCGCFSFYPGKNLGACGEAGAVVTNDADVAARLRTLRDHAQGRRYHHGELGFNYRMEAFQGAVLGIKLKYLEGWTEARRRLAERYQAGLADLPLLLPTEATDRRHVWHLFVALHPQRDRIRQALEERGVQTGLHYPIPVHLQGAYEHLGHQTGDFPVSERIARECFSLPIFPEMTNRQQDRVIETLTEILLEVEYA